MKFYLSLALLWMTGAVLAQKTEKRTVHFEDVDGFSGTVSFELTYSGFATVLSGKKGVLVLEKYDAPTEDLNALLKAGYDLRGYPESGYTPETYSFVIRGQAAFGMVSEIHEAKKLSKLQLGRELGDFTTPEFDDYAKRDAKEWTKRTGKSYWEEYGKFKNIEVTQLYISDFKQTIEKITGKASKERQIEEANEAVGQAEMALMAGNLSRAKSLLDKAWRLDPKSKNLTQASQQYARKLQEKKDRDFENMMIEAKLARQERLRNEAVADAKELNTLRSWKIGSPANFSPQNQARYNELTRKVNNQKLAQINQLFDGIRAQQEVENKKRKVAYNKKMAAMDAAHEREMAAMDAAFKQKMKQREEQWKREEDANIAKVKAVRQRGEEERLAKYGYHKNETAAERRNNIKKMVAELYSWNFSEGLAPLKYFKWGVVNKAGDVVVPFKYNELGRFFDGLALMQTGEGYFYRPEENKYGYIDRQGNEVIKPRFAKARDFREQRAAVKLNDKWGAINTAGNLVIPCTHDYISDLYNGAFVVTDGKLSGYYDRNGREMIARQYDNAQLFSDVGIAVVKKAGKYGVINKQGRQVLKIKYDKIEIDGDGSINVTLGKERLSYDKTGRQIDRPYEVASFGDLEVYKNMYGKLAIVDRTPDGKTQQITEYVIDAFDNNYDGYPLYRIGDKWGYLTEKGDIYFPAVFDAVHGFDQERAAVKYKGKWGFIGTGGTFVIAPEYDAVTDFNKVGFSFVEKRGKEGVIDKNGNEIIPVIYDLCRESSETLNEVCLIEVVINGREGVIDLENKVLVPMVYRSIDINFPKSHLVIVSDSLGAFGIYNILLQKEIIPCVYKKIELNLFSNNNGMVQVTGIDGKVGLIDTLNQVHVPLIYENFGIEYDRMGTRLLSARKDGKWGFIDVKGQPEIKFKFESVSPFSNGYAAYREKGKWGYLNTKGKRITKPVYEEANGFNGTSAIVKINGNYGLINGKGKFLASPIYEGFDTYYNGYARVKLNGHYGYMGKDGKLLLEPVFIDAKENFDGSFFYVTHQTKQKSYDGSWWISTERKRFDKNGQEDKKYTQTLSSKSVK